MSSSTINDTTTAQAPPVPVDFSRVVQRLLAAGGDIALHTNLALYAVSLEDTRAALAERDARIAQLAARLAELEPTPAEDDGSEPAEDDQPAD